jgi:NAD-dependent deacetylase
MSMQEVHPINTSKYSRIVILTGAGISAASGLPTFRGPDGLAQENTRWVSDASNLPDSLPGLWQLYGELRRKALEAQPNAAHLALATLQSRAVSQAVLIATQNVDGLHQRAGSRDVAELHGSALRSRCTNSVCPSQPFEDCVVPDNVVPVCSKCSCPLRPDIVLFNEPLPIDAQWPVKRALRDCDLFLAVGTSGVVSPAADYVRSAAYAGARTILVGLTPMSPPNPYFQEEYIGRAEELLPIMLNV